MFKRNIIVILIFLAGTFVHCQECMEMIYENRNEVDYGPLTIEFIKGLAIDADGVPIPGVCVGIFTEKEHQLVRLTKSDENGYFEFLSLPQGEYRLIGKYPYFCVANAKIKLDLVCGNKKKLVLHMRIPPDGSNFDFKKQSEK